MGLKQLWNLDKRPLPVKTKIASIQVLDYTHQQEENDDCRHLRKDLACVRIKPQGTFFGSILRFTREFLIHSLDMVA